MKFWVEDAIFDRIILIESKGSFVLFEALHSLKELIKSLGIIKSSPCFFRLLAKYPPKIIEIASLLSGAIESNPVIPVFSSELVVFSSELDESVFDSSDVSPQPARSSIKEIVM